MSVSVIYPFIFYFFTHFISHFRALPKPTTPPHTTTIVQPYPKSNTTILNKIQLEPKIQTHNKTKHKIVQIITLIQTLNQERVREDIGRNCKTRNVTHGHQGRLFNLTQNPILNKIQAESRSKYTNPHKPVFVKANEHGHSICDHGFAGLDSIRVRLAFGREEEHLENFYNSLDTGYDLIGPPSTC